MLEMQVMTWDRINAGVRKNALQQGLCATYSANVNINTCLPIKVYYSICTLRHIRIEIIHGSQNECVIEF
jgi:hypothetical protein